MRELELSQVNIFCLRKQHLTNDSKINDIVKTVNDIGGLHATGSTTPYLSLFERIKNFTKNDLDEELYEKRNLGKVRYVRGTVYILSKEMIPIAYSAMKNLVEPKSEQYAKYLGVTKRKYKETSRLILDVLKGNGMTAKEVKKTLETKLNISAILNLMCDQGLLIRGKPKTGWKSSLHTYHLFQEYFPDIDLNKIEENEARNLLVKQYITSFGPVTQKDISWWTGFPKREIREILEDLQDHITWVNISNAQNSYVMLSSDKKPMLSMIPGKKHTVNILPGLEPYIMGYKERERYLDYEYHDRVFDSSGNGVSCILIDGRIMGVWDFTEKPEPMVKIYLFEEVGRTLKKEIWKTGRKTGKFMVDREVQIKECDQMAPLTQRTAGGFMTPLRDC